MKNIFIGDVHGAYSGLKKLLSESNYQSSDRLWFVGDLVNRGSESLDVLKFIADLGDKANVVLGNHDVHMLGVYYGARDYGHKDTFDDVLTHHDAERYIRFMMTRPFAQYCPDLSVMMVHAGIYPAWTVASTLYCSEVLSDKFTSMRKPKKALIKLFGNSPGHWNNHMNAADARRSSLNIFTRMRYLYQKPEKKSWRLEFGYKGSMDKVQSYQSREKKNMQPWFKKIHSDYKDVKVVFGHWSALGFYHHQNICCLDGGYLWGGRMIAMTMTGHNDKPSFYSVSKT